MTVHGRCAVNGQDVTIEIEGDRIAAVRPGAASGLPWVAPGLIDVQVNGFATADFNAAAPTPEEANGAVAALWRRGVTTLYPTVVTGSAERITAALRAIAQVAEETGAGRSIGGIHVEGPYISPEDGPRGAHAAEWVRPPDWDEFQRWQEAAAGRIRLVTLAPEQPGALAFIERLAAIGVVAAIGHTGASPAVIREAVAAGARMSTHLGNGAHAVLPRHPNYIWEQLGDDRLAAGFIADGEHLPPAVLRSLIRAKGIERSVLVSDAVAIAGMPPGRYETLGKVVELLPSGRINLLGTPYLAGASQNLLIGVGNAMRFAGLSLGDALRTATLNPAALLGLKDRERGLVVGQRADLITFTQASDGALQLLSTVVAGEVRYRADQEPGRK